MEEEAKVLFRYRLRKTILSIQKFKSSFSGEKLDEVQNRTKKILDSLNIIEDIMIENVKLKEEIKKLKQKG